MTRTGASDPGSDTASESLTAALRTAPATTADFDLHQPLGELLAGVGLSESDCGGRVDFIGADPVVPSVLRLAGATAIALAAKSIAVAAIWRLRGGRGQDIAMDLRVSPHRLCPFYERKWESLNGYPLGDPIRVDDAFATSSFYRAADGRWVHPMAPYPRLRNDVAALLGVPERVSAVAAAIGRWNADELEHAGAQAGVAMPVVRTIDEMIATEQYRSVLATMPPVVVEKIGDSEPEPLGAGAGAPLEGVRALGRAHVIAGAGCGRALALHGADVLNIWDPNEYEIPSLYVTSNVGVRSAMLDLRRSADWAALRTLLAGGDIFYANRRPGYLARHGLDAPAVAAVRPGIIHATVTLNGDEGPWAGRVGFDQTAGSVAGVMLLEGHDGVPALPVVPVVNDFITAWLLELGVLRALMLRAEQGGSYRVTVSLTRVALWLLSLGTFDKQFASETAGRLPGHEYLDPQTFTVETPLGLYRGVTEQIRMSQTPGYYTNPLLPRGSQPPSWR